MHYGRAQPKNLKQLKEMLHCPMVELKCEDSLSTILSAKDILRNSELCCIVTETAKSDKKLVNIKHLYRKRRVLEKVKKQLTQESPETRAVLVGIYPSLEDPTCLYELQTNASIYVNNNILPSNGSSLKRVIKYITEMMLGTNPTVGGLALILRR